MANLTENFNYLQPTSFKLVLDRRNYPNLEFFCQSITHPGMILNPVELGIPRLSGIPIAGESLTFNELSTNIILDENMQGYGEMYNAFAGNKDGRVIKISESTLKRIVERVVKEQK